MMGSERVGGSGVASSYCIVPLGGTVVLPLFTKKMPFWLIANVPTLLCVVNPEDLTATIPAQRALTTTVVLDGNARSEGATPCQQFQPLL